MLLQYLNPFNWFRSIDNRSPYDNPIGFATFADEVTSGQTGTIEGVTVNADTALTYAPLFRAVSMIANDVASCPLQLHKRTVEPGEDSVLRGHSTNFVVSRRWNKYTTAFSGWRTILAQCELTGNGYAWIVKDPQSGLLKELWNLDPGCVDHRVDSLRNHEEYVVTLNGEASTFSPDEILHVRGLTVRGGKSVDPVEKLKADLTLALGIRVYSIEQASRGFKTPGIIAIPPGAPTEARERLESQIRKRSKDKDHWLSTMVLRDGATWNATGQHNQHALLPDLQEQQTRQVALHYGIPIEKFSLQSSVSYNSATAAQGQYLANTLLCRFKNVQAECDQKLLPRRDYRSGNYVFRHDTDALTESDPAALTEMLVKQRNAGLVSANEARAKLGYSLSTDENADKLLNPQTTDLSDTENEDE